MATLREFRTARYFFFAFIFSTLALSTAIVVYSSFLAWVYADDSRRVEYNYDVSTTPYIIAYVIISAIGGILFLSSLVVLIAFFLSKLLDSKFNMTYLIISISLLTGVFVVPLIIQIVMKQADGFYIWWMVWVLVNVLLGSASIYLIKRTGYMKDVDARNYRPQEGDLILAN